MKRILATLFSIMILMAMTTIALAENSKQQVKIDNKSMSLDTASVKLDSENVESDVPAVNYEGRVLVPMRFILEKLGATVEWNEKTETATIKKLDKTIEVTINNPIMIVNGKEQDLADGVTAKLMSTSTSSGSRTMVPIRSILEALGAEVGWDDATTTVLVTSKKDNVDTNAKPEEKPVSVNEIQGIEIRMINGKEAIVIKNAFGTESESFRLSSPERYVVDIRNTNLKNTGSGIKTDIVKEIRASQYTGGEYPSEEQVSRIVLDISEDYETPEITKERDGNDIIIYVAGTKKPPLVTPPTTPKPPVVVPPVVTPPAPPVPQPTVKKLVAIDAGHGGSDSGASSNGLIEKQLALKVALKVEEKLKNLGHDVIMIRRSDVRLSENTSTDLRLRSEVANNNNADAFLSIHFNSANSSKATGIETYYTARTGQDRAGFAGAIQSELIKLTGAVDRKVKTANFAVTKQTNMVSALTELGFINNPKDAEVIKTDAYLEKCATALANGIHKFLSK